MTLSRIEPATFRLVAQGLHQLRQRVLPFNCVFHDLSLDTFLYVPKFELDNFRKWCRPWEAKSSSVSQEIPHTLCKMKVHYSVLKALVLVPVLNQTNPAHALPSYLRFIITLSMPTPSKHYLFFMFPNENFMHLLCAPYMPHAPALSSFLIWSPE
jgi:hypothetical protein